MSNVKSEQWNCQKIHIISISFLSLLWCMQIYHSNSLYRANTISSSWLITFFRVKDAEINSILKCIFFFSGIGTKTNFRCGGGFVYWFGISFSKHINKLKSVHFVDLGRGNLRLWKSFSLQTNFLKWHPLCHRIDMSHGSKNNYVKRNHMNILLHLG